jgi:hypothetical protein
MRILGAIALAQALLMASRQSDFGLHRTLRAKLSGHQNIKREALFLKQLAHEFSRPQSCRAAAAQEGRDVAFVVNGAPKPELPPRNRHGHLIEVPARGWPRASTPKFSSKQWPELQKPSPRHFVGDIQTSRPRSTSRSSTSRWLSLKRA